jgi:hypothetical protein
MLYKGGNSFKILFIENHSNTPFVVVFEEIDANDKKECRKGEKVIKKVDFSLIFSLKIDLCLDFPILFCFSKRD